MSKRGKRGISKSFREFLVKSYKGRCQYCKESGDTLDHIIPLSKGGARGASNVTLSCKDCNNAKGDDIYPKRVIKPLLEAAAHRVIWMEMLQTLRGVRNKKKKCREKEND
jgi:5-methylcytosine-specific restriction endonuclease McrA